MSLINALRIFVSVASFSLVAVAADEARAEGSFQMAGSRMHLENITVMQVDVLTAGEVINLSAGNYGGATMDSDDITATVTDPAGVVTTFTIDSGSPGWLASNDTIGGQPAMPAVLPNPLKIVSTMVGTYQVRFTNNSSAGDPSWKNTKISPYDITVTPDMATAVNPQEDQGRLSSKLWVFGQTSATITHDFFPLVDIDANNDLTYALELRDFQGVNFYLIANQVGIVDQFGASVRTFAVSKIPENLPEPYHNIYVTPPARANGTNLVPDVTSVSGPVLGCIGAGTSGDINFTSATPGKYEIIVDVDGDGTYERNGDDRILVGLAVAGANTAQWDGLDSEGEPVAATTYDVEVAVSLGEVHFIAADVEKANGIRLMGYDVGSSTYSSAQMNWDLSGVDLVATMPALDPVTTPVGGIASGEKADAIACAYDSVATPNALCTDNSPLEDPEDVLNVQAADIWVRSPEARAETAVTVATFCCGNGGIEADEECDDADLENGDGCSDACEIEDPFFCSSPCTNQTDDPSICTGRGPSVCTTDLFAAAAPTQSCVANIYAWNGPTFPDNVTSRDTASGPPMVFLTDYFPSVVRNGDGLYALAASVGPTSVAPELDFTGDNFFISAATPELNWVIHRINVGAGASVLLDVSDRGNRENKVAQVVDTSGAILAELDDRNPSGSSTSTLSFTGPDDGVVFLRQVVGDHAQASSIYAVPACLDANDVCGDGIQSQAESCDDGNSDDTDGCTNGCLLNNGAGTCFDVNDCADAAAECFSGICALPVTTSGCGSNDAACQGPGGQCVSDVCKFGAGFGPCDVSDEEDVCESGVCLVSLGICAYDSDVDDDGIDDLVDPDDDNDGIPDTYESTGVPGGIDPSGDANANGVPDFLDVAADGFVDDDSNGIDDRYDFDGDGIPNHVDLDSDNDGITDALEGGASDTDGDGVVDGCRDAAPGNGVCDSVDAAALPVPNTDGTGGPDFLDVDADGDGLTDTLEAGGVDADGDGIQDGFDDQDGDGLSDSGAILAPIDTDRNGDPDFQDVDSDDDGIEDAIEGHDQNADGTADATPSGVDTDLDGLDDAFDPDCAAGCGGVMGIPAITPPNLDGDLVPDFRDVDSDNDGTFDADEATDADGNGTPDYLQNNIGGLAGGSCLTGPLPQPFGLLWLLALGSLAIRRRGISL